MKSAIFAVAWMLAGAALTTVIRVDAFDLASAKPAPGPPHPLLSSEMVMIAEHFDRRMDRLERMVAQADSDADDAKQSADSTRTEQQNILSAQDDVLKACKNR